MPLERLYTGYRQNVMMADEMLGFVRVPKAGALTPALSQRERERELTRGWGEATTRYPS